MTEVSSILMKTRVTKSMTQKASQYPSYSVLNKTLDYNSDLVFPFSFIPLSKFSFLENLLLIGNMKTRA